MGEFYRLLNTNSYKSDYERKKIADYMKLLRLNNNAKQNNKPRLMGSV